MTKIPALKVGKLTESNCILKKGLSDFKCILVKFALSHVN